ncbi:MAG: FHA domain-containing protein [Bdellovibrionaceae bacterium]|nr:FHA domain-containing protein [Pseudobdellovibrionaceae bacterium]
MWAIKILNGAQSGKIFPLQKGNNVLGRSAKVDIRFADQGVSKNHAQIFVTNDKVIISDLKSSNGTFVNGVKVQNHGLKTGDKVLVNQTIFTIFQLPDNVVFADPKMTAKTPPAQISGATSPQNHLAVQGTNALQPMMTHDMGLAPYNEPQQQMVAPVPITSHANPIEAVAAKADKYIEEVALPPIYKTAEKVDFKYLLMVFALAFIFLSTFLSALPLSKLTTDSVITESKRRTLTLARNLAQLNRKALSEDSELSLSTEFVERESGVEKAMILSAKSGAILAPASMMGRYLKEPFIISLRNTNEEKVDVINEKQVAASVPIKFFNPDIGDSSIAAYAVVVYNVDPLAIDFNRTLSLFIQIFLIACTIGAIVFFIQYRLMVFPLKKLNKEIDKALSEGHSNIQVPFQLPIFQNLIMNINSALSRVSADFTGTDDMAASADKSIEAHELVKMFPVPAFAVNPESSRFMAINAALEGHPLFDTTQLVDVSIEELTDTSLFQCLKYLMDTCRSNPNMKHTQTIPSNGSENYEITAKSIVDGKKASYVIFTVMQIIEEEDEG